VLAGSFEGGGRRMQGLARRFGASLAHDRFCGGVGIDPSLVVHEDRLEAKEAFVAIVAGNVLASDENEEVAGLAAEALGFDRAGGSEAAEVVGAGVLEDAIDDRVADGEELGVGAGNGQLAVERGLTAALGKAERAEHIGNQKLQEIALALDLAAVEREEPLGETGEVG
jgi:hypothetical protein